MTDEITRIYWDADVFIAYINEEPGRIPIIEALLDKISKDQKSKIVTSTITKVEVAWLGIERENRTLLPEEFRKIDLLIGNYNIVELIEFDDSIATEARELMRLGMESGKKLRTNDAIHLASAIRVNVQEFNTYNINDYRHFSQFVGFQIREPITDQPELVFKYE